MKTTDGRQARSERTRAKVAEAMLDCLEEGLLRPSAKKVAERAGVSSRAVFRHFDNMEALLEQANQLQFERIMSKLPAVVTEGTLDERIDALILHSNRRNEIIAPVRRASLLSEPFSKSIRDGHAYLRAIMRRQVRAVFSEELGALSEMERSDRVAALRVLLSFSNWEELRRHERLSREVSARVLRSSVVAILEL